ncbi:MAG: hypothetical protein WDN50_07840 [Bradyrhizobium sp.]
MLVGLLHLVFPEIELPYPQSKQDKGYSTKGKLPVGLVDRVHVEAHHSGTDEEAADNLIWFHEDTIARGAEA